MGFSGKKICSLISSRHDYSIMRISVVVPDISSNAMARTCPIAETLAEDHDVKIFGFDRGDGFFEPYRDEFDCEAFSVGKTPYSLVKNSDQLERMIDGDVVYAFRPVVGSLGVALAHKRRRGTPVLLDVEDVLRYDSYPIYKKLYNIVRSSGDPAAGTLSPILPRLLEKVDAVTVTSTHLQDRYGGTVLPYGPDANEFNPETVEPHPHLVSKYSRNRIIVFIGTIRPHKGLDVLADALASTPEDVRLVVAGYDPHDIVPELQSRSGGKVDFLGPIPHDDVPAYLRAATLVVIPQKRTPYTRAQIPNKLFEAMSMGKPIVASATADIPDILGDAGRIVEPSNPNELATEIVELVEDPDLAEQLGRAARERYLEEYSRSVLRSRLNGIIDSVVTK